MTLTHIGEVMAVRPNLLIHWSSCNTALCEQNEFLRASSGNSKHHLGWAYHTHSHVSPGTQNHPGPLPPKVQQRGLGKVEEAAGLGLILRSPFVCDFGQRT